MTQIAGLQHSMLRLDQPALSKMAKNEIAKSRASFYKSAAVASLAVCLLAPFVSIFLLHGKCTQIVEGMIAATGQVPDASEILWLELSVHAPALAIDIIIALLGLYTAARCQSTARTILEALED